MTKTRYILSIMLLALAASILPAAFAASEQKPVTVGVMRSPSVAGKIRVSFRSVRRLPRGGYYYAVIVLKPYKKYTRTSPPPCSTSSDMQRTDYGYPSANGQVTLFLTPAKSSTGHWCPGGTYIGGVYAVPYAPPCEGNYLCRSELYEQPCAGIRPGCVHGVVAHPREWQYPQGLPKPLADGTKAIGHFTVRFR